MIRSYVRLISVGLLAALFGFSAAAAPFKTEHKFTGKAEGGEPLGGMIATKKGTLVGIAFVGGIVDNANFCGDGCGTIFEFDPATGKFTTLYKFTGGDDGHSPNGDLVADKNGVIYGTTGFGGKFSGGTIYKIDPATKVFTTLYTFGSGAVGTNPNALTIDRNGILYGSTFFGGTRDFGTLFKFDPATHKATAMHVLGSKKADPINLNTRMVIDKNGDLYGVSQSGGTNNFGALFKFDSASKSMTILHSFTDADGQPEGGLAIAGGGMLYGIASQTGSSATNCETTGCGQVYRFNPVTHVLATVHAFANRMDGTEPSGDLVLDTKSNTLYGETSSGGAGKRGVLFKLDPATRELMVLHPFSGGADGAVGFGQAVTLGPNGVLYGAAPSGGLANKPICGTDGCGVLFRVSQ
jgi:uncharacterized repeat protein (TIGR03803 family)